MRQDAGQFRPPRISGTVCCHLHSVTDPVDGTQRSSLASACTSLLTPRGTAGLRSRLGGGSGLAFRLFAESSHLSLGDGVTAPGTSRGQAFPHGLWGGNVTCPPPSPLGLQAGQRHLHRCRLPTGPWGGGLRVAGGTGLVPWLLSGSSVAPPHGCFWNLHFFEVFSPVGHLPVSPELQSRGAASAGTARAPTPPPQPPPERGRAPVSGARTRETAALPLCPAPSRPTEPLTLDSRGSVFRNR